MIGFGIIFPALLLSAHLTVEVKADGIWLRFFPLHRRMWRLAKEEVLRHEAITYRALRDFGGWGIRYGSLGIAYSVSGNRGVMLSLPRKRDIMIGSLRADELDQAIERMLRY